MREYEITVVLKPDIEDTAQEELLSAVEGWLTQGEGESGKLEQKHWGLRALAYPIKKYTQGYYVYYEAKLETEQVKDIERNILYTDEILRHLVVKKES